MSKIHQINSLNHDALHEIKVCATQTALLAAKTSKLETFVEAYSLNVMQENE